MVNIFITERVKKKKTDHNNVLDVLIKQIIVFIYMHDASTYVQNYICITNAFSS